MMMTTQEIQHINYYDYLYRFKFIYFNSEIRENNEMSLNNQHLMSLTIKIE